MKKYIFGIAVIAIIGVSVGFYLYNKKPMDTRKVDADFEMSAVDLVKEFNANEETATKKFSDKVLIVSGKVNEIPSSLATIFLSSDDPLASVTCSFYADEAEQLKGIKIGDEVKIKGKCTGKLTDVVLNNCSLIH